MRQPIVSPNLGNAGQIGEFPVAPGTNRISSQGNVASKKIDAIGQTSRVIATSIAAGATIPFAAAGTEFYLSACSSTLNIKPSNGEFVAYVQGTGLDVKSGNAFNSVQINNPNNFPVVFQLFIGFDGFIDNRLYEVIQSTPNVAYPTYSVPNLAPAVAITDLSGQGFFDINGNPWLALYRQYIVVCNLDASAVMLVQAAGALTGNGPAIAMVQPLTSWIEQLSGNYSLNLGGGNINAVVHEIYAAIPPSGALI